MDLKTGIVPVSYAASRLAKLMVQSKETGQPVIITQRGFAAGVLLAVDQHAALSARAVPDDLLAVAQLALSVILRNGVIEVSERLAVEALECAIRGAGAEPVGPLSNEDLLFLISKTPADQVGEQVGGR